ncbi:MAG: twin-arginine translocase subunit TatC [Actinomycetota bacterium]|jgi:sec-independent protein translocase protein TatC
MSFLNKKTKQSPDGMTLGQHLAEVRRRFMISIGAVVAFGFVAWFQYGRIIKFLQHPYCRVASITHEQCKFLMSNPLDGLSLHIKIAFFGGLVLALPVLFFQAWRFITPGLRKQEKRYVVPFVIASILFFLGGATMAYFSFERALEFLQQIGGSSLQAFYNPNQYFSLILLMMFVFGVTFEFPVVLVALQLAGVVTPKQLLSWWRYALIGITAAAAIFTPSGDPVSMFALVIPLTIFYFFSIAIGKIARK